MRLGFCVCLYFCEVHQTVKPFLFSFTGKPPAWNYQNPHRKVPIKQSEKDPLFEEKRQESEERRAKRERQLHYLVEINKNVIPTERTASSMHKAASAEPLDIEDSKLRSRGRERNFQRNGPSAVSTGDLSHRTRSPPLDSQAGKRSHRSGRSLSPPVPAVRHKIGKESTEEYKPDYDVDAHSYRHYHNRIGDGLSAAQVHQKSSSRSSGRESDFIPFTRTTDVLDPSSSEEPIKLSRENTHIVQARQRYHENLNPGDYGNQLEFYSDRQRTAAPKKKVRFVT